MEHIKENANGLHICGDNNGTEKMGFYAATPVIQPASADQTVLTDSTGGGVTDATLAAITDTTSDVSSDINDNFAKIAELVNSLRADLVSLGLIKGSA